MDTHITDNIDYIVRLAETGPKVTSVPVLLNLRPAGKKNGPRGPSKWLARPFVALRKSHVFTSKVRNRAV